MQRTRILVLEGVTGTNYTYAKGENEVPHPIAVDLVNAGHARFIDPPADVENAASKTAKNAEKRPAK